MPRAGGPAGSTPRAQGGRSHAKDEDPTVRGAHATHEAGHGAKR
jgi:hypothetical protein